ncbi:DUF2306 domain-containing protein [Dyadobacter sandarakinus]|uniref:DUF2306 domain-containing protein n=1 Tax=Dyadobacter sandarakinus TaxID=2747268 RepID=A0ABX7IAT6_9BACT|nr:DUF2306 domain-containing protein [Dyadobacter sandarakinus]QRR03095.1 DUF2306 domain-containing protein [Dyadobacter sandarakinus]
MKTEMLSDNITASTQQSMLQRVSFRMLEWSSRILTVTVWTSASLFGLYILAFYAAALYQGDMQRWNGVLPKLYQTNAATATTGIGMHFAAGGIILILGSIQLIDSVRLRFPAAHRWIGRIYITACLFASVGGLIFIVVTGTIGGTVMNIGFGLYGILMGLSAVQTYRHAVKRNTEAHRLWALRLYALAIGSWLYRMDYGFWIMLTNGLGHAKGFRGPFDQIMAFFFYIPNLLVVEALVRARTFRAAPSLKIFTSILLLCATGFLGVGTYYFTLYYWGPAILKWAGIQA